MITTQLAIKKSLYLLVLFLSSHLLSAQHEQLWLDYQLDLPFKNRFLFENTASYQTLLSNNDKWRSISLSTCLEYVLFNWMDLTAEVPVGYTFQQDNYNTIEISPIIGTRFHITQNRRINSRILVRYQERNYYQIEADDWDTSNRVRLKGELSISVNGPNLFTDKLWYTMIDYEEFFVLDEQLKERYANLRRFRIGLGYRLSYRNRFELNYAIQSSRNEIEGEFVRADNLIWLKYKMFLNPSKPPVPANTP